VSASILIVDDEPVVLKYLSLQVEQLGYRVAGAFQSGEQALTFVENGASKPDLALIDIGLPGMDGVKLIRRLRNLAPFMAILVLTVFDDSPTVVAAVRAGARGYLLKDTPPDELERALATLGTGGVAMAAAATRHMIDFFHEQGLAEGSSSAAEDVLTPREHEVLTLLARGLTYADIARVLTISVGTVQTHVKSIYSKLGVTTKAEVTAVAIARKLVDPWSK
jgi:DNA-binding NarL/FixJ family response regulator